MKKFLLVSPETLVKIGNVFANSEEVSQFIENLEVTCGEIQFLSMLRSKIEEKEAPVTVLQQICAITIFCREHMDVMQELVRNLEGKQVTEEDFKKYMEDS